MPKYIVRRLNLTSETMKTTVITATKAEKCALCGEQYAPGARIVKDYRTGQWVMADCLWPKKNVPQRNPTPTRVDALTEVSARLDAAVGIMCRRFNKQPIDVNPDSYVLAEIMRQLYGQQWLDKGFGK